MQTGLLLGFLVGLATCCPRGLNPDAVYVLTNFDVAGATEMSGRELLEKGISVVMKDQPGSTVIVCTP